MTSPAPQKSAQLRDELTVIDEWLAANIADRPERALKLGRREEVVREIASLK